MTTHAGNQQAALTNFLYEKAYTNEFGVNPVKHAPTQWKHFVYVGSSNNTPPMSNYEMCARTNWTDTDRRKNVGGKIKGIGKTKRTLRYLYSIITLYGLIPTWLSFIEKTLRVACTIVIGAAFAKLLTDYGSSVTTSTDPTRNLNQDIQFTVAVTFGVTLFYALIYGIPMAFRYCKGIKRRRNRDAFSKLIADILSLDSLADTYENEYDSDEDPHRAFTYFNDVNHLYMYFSSLPKDNDSYSGVDDDDDVENATQITTSKADVDNLIENLKSKLKPSVPSKSTKSSSSSKQIPDPSQSDAVALLAPLLPNQDSKKDDKLSRQIKSTCISLNAWKMLLNSNKTIDVGSSGSITPFAYYVVELLQAPIIGGCNYDYYAIVGATALLKATNKSRFPICCSRDTISADGKSYSYLGSESKRFN
jgi:hypothetical protein